MFARKLLADRAGCVARIFVNATVNQPDNWLTAPIYIALQSYFESFHNVIFSMSNSPIILNAIIIIVKSFIDRLIQTLVLKQAVRLSKMSSKVMATAGLAWRM